MQAISNIALLFGSLDSNHSLPKAKISAGKNYKIQLVRQNSAQILYSLCHISSFEKQFLKCKQVLRNHEACMNVINQC